jgi:phage terminase large subunit
MTAINADFPEKLQPLFRPMRYKVLYGGRGGSKSWGIARALILLGAASPLRVLCARELQNSIQESVHRLLSDQIEALGLSGHYDILKQGITGKNGTEFIFAGIKNNPTKIKSTEGIDIVWVEEAEKVSSESWQILIPTVRKPGSEIWVSFNPDDEKDPTYQRFVVNTPPECVLIPLSWRDNPWFPEVLRAEKDYLASVDPEAYEHVWNGKCRKHSHAQILKGKYTVAAFEQEPGWNGPYFGADWGFSNDPTTLVQCFIHEETLFIRREVWGVGIELDEIPGVFERIDGSKKYVIRADNARPETISYLKRNGYPLMAACEKWKGCVEDGISRLRAFKSIVIHPDCRHTADEAHLYSYKVDKITGDILPDIVDAHNHCWDAIRYALEPIIKGHGKMIISGAALTNARRRAT